MAKHTLRSSPVRTILTAAASLSLAVVIALFGVGGTYALWTSTAEVSPAVTLSSGSAALSVGTFVLPPTALYPGLTIYAPVIVQNTGTVPLTVRVAGLISPADSPALTQSLTVGVAPESTATCTTPTWTGTFAANVPAAVTPTVLAPEASFVLCVSLALSVDAPATAQGQTAGFGIVLDGLQA